MHEVIVDDLNGFTTHQRFKLPGRCFLKGVIEKENRSIRLGRGGVPADNLDVRIFGKSLAGYLGGNRTMLATVGAVEGASYYLWVIQDGTGTRTITWTTSGAGSFDFGTDGAPTLTTTASRADLLCFEAISIAGTLKLRFAGIKKGFA